MNRVAAELLCLCLLATATSQSQNHPSQQVQNQRTTESRPIHRQTDEMGQRDRWTDRKFRKTNSQVDSCKKKQRQVDENDRDMETDI